MGELYEIVVFTVSLSHVSYVIPDLSASISMPTPYYVDKLDVHKFPIGCSGKAATTTKGIMSSYISASALR